MKNFCMLMATLIGLNLFAQTEKKYQGLLWKISGNGLSEDSYLYGTMHVSNRVAFHLSEDFFKALEAADVVALETNPGEWINHFTDSRLFQDYYTMGYRYNGRINPLYKSFIPQAPKQLELGYYISRDQELLNNFLYRASSEEQDFSEDTFLDLFIYQAGVKQGKTIVALEDFEKSFLQVNMANKYDKDAKRSSDRQREDLLGDYNHFGELQEDAYRKGDLDMLDTMTSILNPGKYYRRYMLDDRNQIMADGMDSLMRAGQVLFTGVGAAHLPGRMGVINLLRQMGYTVTPMERTITSQSIEEKEKIDAIIHKHGSYNFSTEDGFVQLTSPAPLAKIVSDPFQEYVYADMANGGFYSLRRISNFAPLYGLSIADYQAKVDSLLFENIPGKIDDKREIEINGFRGLDIRNTTKKGDQQRYHIIFTPMEVLIFKVGGLKSFVESEQPKTFFNSIVLQAKSSSAYETYTAPGSEIQVDLPTSIRIRNGEGVFQNPNATTWVQAVNEDGAYYSLGYRQLYDWNYIEEDDFELKYLVKRIAREKKLDLDTLYLSGSGSAARAHFILKNKREGNIYGQSAINGARYAFLLTTDADSAAREAYFESLKFPEFTYADEFQTYVDTNMHVQLKLPRDPNNFETTLRAIYNRNSEDRPYANETRERIIIYPPTGEQLLLRFRKYGKYDSYETEDEIWEKASIMGNHSLIEELDSSLYSRSEEGDYFTAARQFRYSDTASQRVLHVKSIIENGAMYSLYALSDSSMGPSTFAREAMESFAPAGDTLFGKSLLVSRAPILFADIRSSDSTLIYAATHSISQVDYDPEHQADIIDIFENFQHKEFEREDRLSLLNRLAFTKSEDYVDYLAKAYYHYIDSSAYQFKILETLLDYEREETNELFLKLILDEAPFTSDNYKYSSLFREFQDSLELAAVVFPDILELTDFEDYKDPVYDLLEALVEKDLIKSKKYRSKSNSILRYAKVAYKKQRAKDEGKSNSSYNGSLSQFNLLLVPYGKRSEVKKHFENVMRLKNKRIVTDQLEYISQSIDVPDSTYNYLAKDDKARMDVFEYLVELDKTELLKSEYLEQSSLNKSIALQQNYSGYDTLAYMGNETVETKKGLMRVYFYQAKDKDDQLWQMIYVASPDSDEPTSEIFVADKGERFNPIYDDFEEIKKDILREVETHERERVVNDDYSSYY